MKPKLFLDFDGCIADSIRAIVDLYNDDFKAYPNFRYMYPDDIHTWDFAECKCAAVEIINTYFTVPRFFERLHFMKHAECILSLLSKHFDITIVSFGVPANLKLKKLWIEKNIPFAKFIGLDSNIYSDKSIVDMSNGIFVDDSVANLESSNASTNIIFGEYYPWNTVEKGFVRCTSWIELYWKIMEFLKKEEVALQ